MTKAKDFARVNQHLTTIIYVMLAAVIPFILLPIGDIFFIESKQFLFLLVGLLTLIGFAIHTITKKTIQFTFSPFFLPLALFGFSALLSSFFTVGLPIQHLVGFGGVLLTATVIALLGPTLLGEQKTSTILLPIGIGTGILALASLAELGGIGPSKIASSLLGVPFNPTSFNLSGSHTIAFQLFLATFVATFVSLLHGVKQKTNTLPFINVVLLVIIGAGMLVSGYQVFTLFSQGVANLPFQASWDVATQTFKSARSTIIGVGPANYGHAYLQFKPEWMNTTKLWDLQFSYGSDMPLTLISTMGVLGLATWIAFAVQVVRALRKSQSETMPLGIFILLTLVLQLLFPPNVIILAVQALALAFWVAADDKISRDTQLHTFTVSHQRASASQKLPEHNHALAYGASALLILFAIAGLYWFGRASIAQAYIFRGNIKAVQKDALGLYDSQRQANIFFPYSDAYHRAYSSTNMSMAIAVSGEPDLTDEQKSQVVTLIQQAIREGKAATTLAPTNAINWINLARVYTNLIGVAQQSESWALSAYAQASLTAPTDPGLQLELGGLVYRLGRYEDASRVFEKAVRLKPDWANAYYNLANSYRMATQSDKALAAYQSTLSLVQGNPEEVQKLRDEVSAYQAQLKNGTATKATKPAATPVATSSSALAAPNATASAQFTQEVSSELQDANLEGPTETP